MAAQRALASAPRGLLHDAPIHEEDLALPAAPEGEDIVHDYAALGLTLRRHPLALLRERLARRGVRSSAQLDRLPHGRKVIACGLVIGRQQPGTAKGTIFVTLEDETGPVNVIVWESLRFDEAQRNALLRSQLLAVHGEWQRDQGSDEAALPALSSEHTGSNDHDAAQRAGAELLPRRLQFLADPLPARRLAGQQALEDGTGAPDRPPIANRRVDPVYFESGGACKTKPAANPGFSTAFAWVTVNAR